jgi:hypothetical protein
LGRAPLGARREALDELGVVRAPPPARVGEPLGVERRDEAQQRLVLQQQRVGHPPERARVGGDLAHLLLRLALEARRRVLHRARPRHRRALEVGTATQLVA